jgi:hypothetical protein
MTGETAAYPGPDGGRRLRSDGQQRDARVGSGWIGEREWRWRALLRP